MMESLLILTNNPAVMTELGGDCLWVDGDPAQVAKEARDLVHRGYKFHSHPMAGSIRLLRNPYRTMILQKGSSSSFLEQVRMAEEATRRLSSEVFRKISKAEKDDYIFIDLDLFKRSFY